MRNTCANFARALDTLWLIAMGLFLGLTAGLVLAVILTFQGARQLDAAPGIGPYNDPRFALHQNDAVAGYIGQHLFMVGGSVALTLLAIALIARVGHGLLLMTRRDRLAGSLRCSQVRGVFLIFCILCMVKGASLTLIMNKAWPDLYDQTATDSTLASRRAAFEALHEKSEKVVGAAWFGGLITLLFSPWCRRIAEAPVQSGDGKKENG